MVHLTYVQFIVHHKYINKFIKKKLYTLFITASLRGTCHVMYFLPKERHNPNPETESLNKSEEMPESGLRCSDRREEWKPTFTFFFFTKIYAIYYQKDRRVVEAKAASAWFNHLTPNYQLSTRGNGYLPPPTSHLPLFLLWNLFLWMEMWNRRCKENFAFVHSSNVYEKVNNYSSRVLCYCFVFSTSHCCSV